MSAETDSRWASESAPEALARYAPEVAAALADLVATNPTGFAGPLVAFVRTTCAEALALTPLPTPDLPTPNPATVAGRERVALEFAEQFSVDVSVVDAATRAALVDALSHRTGTFVTSVYVADWAPRLRRVLEQLFGPAPTGWAAPNRWNEADDDLWPLVDAFLRSVAKLRVLDPVTTELVRLREARQHNCRLCKSLRSRSALAAGAEESTFDQVDNHSDSALSDRHKAALALTDAMVWQPGHIGADVIDAVRQHFSPAEAVELVVDMMRNASSKIAVATGTDQARVSEGVEIYDVNADGTLDFGLTAPV
ncbi:carboxymuconolactone decarboxylase family protein [Rhodococcus sp. NPDC127528]|uniref:carboxymuconolactone decarboxylase family protein n=1 Tax=unclassified Rhodococcus (in: high G+C Gram-positive bacteria) TaxID=192944 RepID=UPI00362E871F